MTECEKCGAKCCKVALIQTTEANAYFLEETRGAITSDMGLLIPARCIFLDEHNKCSIYDHRPLACALWPVNGDGCNAIRKAME